MSYIVVTAEPSKLRKVRRRLRRKGYQAYLPAIARRKAFIRHHKDMENVVTKYQIVVSPLMSYILIKTLGDGPVDERWLLDLLSVNGVRRVLRRPTDNWPAAVPDEVVALVRLTVAQMLSTEREETRKIKKKLARNFLRSGATARIRAGVLTGKYGTIVWVKGAKAALETQVFGSMRVVEVKAKDLEAA